MGEKIDGNRNCIIKLHFEAKKTGKWLTVDTLFNHELERMLEE